MTKALESPQYQDVQLTAMLLEIDSLLRKICAVPDNLLTDEEKGNLLREICQHIRKAKLHFATVVDRYGLNYGDSADRLVQITSAAANQAEMLKLNTLGQSLQRHLDGIRNAIKKAEASW